MAKIRALAVDFGGTLAHPGPPVDGWTVVRILSGELGLALPESFAPAFDAVRRHTWLQDRSTGAHTSFSEVLTTAALQCGVRLPCTVDVAEAVFSHIPDGRVDEDAARALSRLYCGGMRGVLACDTQRPAEVRRRTLQVAGISDCLPALVLSSVLGWRKPHPRFYDAVIEAAGAEPEEILFVGDTPAKDAIGPCAHGMAAVLIACGRPRGLDLRIGVIRRFAELPAYLEGRYVS